MKKFSKNKKEISQKDWTNFIKRPPHFNYTGAAKGVIINHYIGDLPDQCCLRNLFNLPVINYPDFSYEEVDKYDYIVLSGGPTNLSKLNKEENQFVFETQKPIFAICLGMQLLAVLDESQLSVYKENLIYKEELEVYGRVGEMYYFHQCYLNFMPKSYTGITDTCVRVMEKGPILGVQGHPGGYIRDQWIKKYL
jgi:hypothetical protein